MGARRRLPTTPLQAIGVDALWLLDCDPTDPPLAALPRAGLSLHDVAERAGLPYSNYRRLEQGLRRRLLPQPMFDALAVALGVTTGEVQQAIQRSLSAPNRLTATAASPLPPG